MKNWPYTKADKKKCPKCGSDEVYHNGERTFCIKCNYEFSKKDLKNK